MVSEVILERTWRCCWCWFEFVCLVFKSSDLAVVLLSEDARRGGRERGERRGPVSDIDFYSRDRREQGRSGVEVHHQSEGKWGECEGVLSNLEAEL